MKRDFLCLCLRHQGSPESSIESIEVLVDREGGYAINGRRLINSEVESLVRGLELESGGDVSRLVVLVADAEVRHQAVVSAMEAIGRAGFVGLSIATREAFRENGMTFIERAWYHKAKWLYALWPSALAFYKLAARRRKRLSVKAEKWPVPVVVVGNISVGGTGKTPLLIALVAHLKNQGINPGVVSRGYGGKSEDFPVNVTGDTAVQESGDEALLIARHCGCPVVIDPDRVAAITCLLDRYSVDVVLCDDGLQHYAMARDIELIVVDGERQFGNEFCLPAGPLREPLSRLGEADLVIVNVQKAMSPEVRATLLNNSVSWSSNEEKQTSSQPLQEKRAADTAVLRKDSR